MPPGVPHLTGRVLSGPDLTTVVHQSACAAQQMVPTAVGAGISLFDEHGTGVSTAVTDPAVEAADTAQYALGRSPCLSAWATGDPQLIEDTSTEPRWPGWVAAAAQSGIRSVLSAPLTHHGHALGALKAYASVPGAFAVNEERLLGSLASTAAALLGAGQATEAPVRLSAALKVTLAARETVGLATGVLMAREHLDPEAARALMLERARTQGRPVAEIAAEVVDGAVGHEQALRLRTTMVAADIGRGPLHLYHYGIGGDATELEVDAYLHHALSLPRLQRDLLAHAANEILDNTVPPRAPYAADILVDRTFPARNPDRAEGYPLAGDSEVTEPENPAPLEG